MTAPIPVLSVHCKTLKYRLSGTTVKQKHGSSLIFLFFFSPKSTEITNYTANNSSHLLSMGYTIEFSDPWHKSSWILQFLSQNNSNHPEKDTTIPSHGLQSKNQIHCFGELQGCKHMDLQLESSQLY